MKRELFKTGFAIAVLRAINIGLGFVVTILLSRVLGPAGLGIYAYAIVLITLASVPVSYGWGTLLLRTTSAGQYNDGWSETKGLAIRGAHIALLISGFGLLSCFILKALAPTFLPKLPPPLILTILLIILLFDQLSALRNAMLRGMNYNIMAQIPEMVVRPALLITVFLCLLLVMENQITVRHAFAALLVASFANMIFGYILLWRKIPAALLNASPTFFNREWLTSAIPLATSSGLIILNTTIDILVLGIYAEPADIGAYRVAVQVGLFSGFAYTSLNMLATPRFAHSRAAEDKNGIQVTATFLARLAFLGALPLPLVLLFAGYRIIPFVFSSEFVTSLVPMIILSLGQLLNAAVGMPQTLLVINGMEKRVMYMTGFALLTNLVLCMVLIPAFGMVGAASAMVIATGLWNTALWITARQVMEIDTSVLGFSVKKHSSDNN